MSENEVFQSGPWPASPSATSPLIGREHELGAVQQVLQGDSGPAGVVLVGPMGIGKSRLAHEVATRSSTKRSITSLRPTPAGTSNGVTACPSCSGEHERYIRKALRSALHPASRDRSIIIIDDAHFLTPNAIDLVYKIANSGAAKMLLTIASEHDGGQFLHGLWKDGYLKRIDLEPLPSTACAMLASELSGNRLTQSSTMTLGRLSNGNPLLLRELIRVAKDQQLLDDRQTQWKLCDQVLSSAALENLIQHSMPALGTVERNALEVIALAGSAHITAVENLFGATTLVRLEERHLIEVTGLEAIPAMTQRSRVKCKHPLVEQALRQSIPILRGRSHLRNWLAAMKIAPQDLNPADKVHLTEWYVRVGEKPPCELITEAVRCSLVSGDSSTAIRLGAYHWNSHRSPEVAEAYLQALLAGASFDLLYAMVRDASEACEIAAAEGKFAQYRIRALLLEQRYIEAMEEIGSLHGPTYELLASIAAYSQGQFGRSLHFSTPLIDQSDPEYATEAARLTMAALCHIGRPKSALEVYKRLHDRRLADGSSSTISDVTLEQLYASALQQCGYLAEAEAVLVTDRQSGSGVEHSLTLGSIYLEMGKVREALPHLAALPEYQVGWHQWHRRADILKAIAHAWLPQLDRPLQLGYGLQEPPPGNHTTELLVARAWLHHIEGNEEIVLSLLQQAISGALQDGAYSDAAMAVHNMARLGYAKDALDSADMPVEGDFLKARIDFTRGVALRSTNLLVDAANCFAGMGAHLYAAESYAELARLQRRAGNERAATASTSKAHMHLEECGRVETPPLRFLGQMTPLSAREQTIASLAARGLSDKEIAERLVISPRTVGNTLYRVYQKIGVTGRRPLRAALSIAETQLGA